MGGRGWLLVLTAWAVGQAAGCCWPQSRCAAASVGRAVCSGADCTCADEISHPRPSSPSPPLPHSTPRQSMPPPRDIHPLVLNKPYASRCPPPCREWVEYHTALGVGRFYIFGTDSLQPYTEVGWGGALGHWEANLPPYTGVGGGGGTLAVIEAPGRAGTGSTQGRRSPSCPQTADRLAVPPPNTGPPAVIVPPPLDPPPPLAAAAAAAGAGGSDFVRGRGVPCPPLGLTKYSTPHAGARVCCCCCHCCRRCCRL